MTVDEYYAIVKTLKLRPTNVPTVYLDPSGEPYNVPDPSEYTPEERVAVISRLKRLLGVE